MPSLTPLVVTTELDAVNVLLAAIGEQAVSDITVSTSADVELAADILRRVSVAVQTEEWRFNTEFGVQVAPDGTVAWTGVDGSTATLNVFAIPANVLSYSLTQSSEQISLNAMTKRSVNYQDATPATILCIWDRDKNREGWDSSRYPFLYIDPVYVLPFEELPQVAREYIVQRAGRMFAERSVGSSEVASFSEKEEFKALRNLKRKESIEDDLNVIESSDTIRIWSNRRINALYAVDPRSSTGTV